jgi:hypothetical protein
MSEENNDNTIVQLVENGFKDVSESITEIHETIALLYKRIENLENELKTSKTDNEDKKQPKKKTKDKTDITEFDTKYGEKFDRLYKLYTDNDIMLTPLSEIAHFIIMIDTMVEGTSPKTDAEIVSYILETYGKRSVHYIRACLIALKSSSRITLTRTLKRIEEKISSSKKIKNENADNIKEEKKKKETDTQQDETDEDDDEVEDGEDDA